MMSWMNLNFQNPNSISMMKLVMFNYMMMILIINIMTIMMTMMKFNMMNKFNNKTMLQNQKLEIMWTMTPILIIVMISLTSMKLLFMNNEMKNNLMSIKVMGNQWFWNYEYPMNKTSYNSYLMTNNKFNFMMLETDNNLIVPFNYQTMMIMSSMDVIHSWTLPSMNIKMDCIPNQINSLTMMINKPTIMYGQCSEICGINHSFMPIKVESININNLIKWM